MKRETKTHDVVLPNGESRRVIEWPDPESSYDMIFSPKRMDGTGYGVACESLENAIKFMFQADCEHNVITNNAVSDKPHLTLLPYKCTKCNKHFVYWKII
jgi:hypothetical protein